MSWSRIHSLPRKANRYHYECITSASLQLSDYCVNLVSAMYVWPCNNDLCDSFYSTVSLLCIKNWAFLCGVIGH